MTSEFHLIGRLQNTPVPTFQDFEHQQIGRGSFGKVYKSIHKVTKKVYAIKALSKLDQKTNDYKPDWELERINHQLNILYQLNCQFVIKTYDHFQDKLNIYVVMEYVDGVQLYKGIIKKNKKLQNFEIAKIIYQLCQALQYLHDKNIIHRDIKPQNIMVSKTKDIKLIDFGTSNFIGPQQTRRTKTGSQPYFAPQIVKEARHGSAVDVWCVGILLYQMFTLKTPFQEYQKTQINILLNKVNYPSNMDSQMKDLISKILVKEADKRISLKQIIKHPWITKLLFKQSSLLTPRSRSKSFQKSQVMKRISSKQKIINKQSQKSLPKPPSKIVKSEFDLLKLKISKINKQISEVALVRQKYEQKKKDLLLKKITQKQQKIQKCARQTVKYESIIKINNKKIQEMKNQYKEIDIMKIQYNHVQSLINDKKQQYLDQNNIKSQLRSSISTIQSKIRMNRNSRKGIQRKSNSHQKSSSSLTKWTPTHKASLNNSSNSVQKYKLSQTDQFSTQSSYRQDKIAEIQAYIKSLTHKENIV